VKRSRAPEPPRLVETAQLAAPTAPENESLRQLREANARLIIAGAEARTAADRATLETARAGEEVTRLKAELQRLTERLVEGEEGARALAAESRERQEQYRRLSGRLLTLQDEERRRLALDLHDTTAQRLIALLMHLDTIAKAESKLDATSRRAVAASRSLAERCTRELRTLAYVLHPPLLDELGLRSALRWLIDGFTRRSGIHVELFADDVGRFPRAVETALFRVVQESLANVHRHASDASVVVRLARTSHTLALDVHDDGRGLREDDGSANGPRQAVTLGVGVQGMRERITQLGGTFDITFSNQGTSVRVRLPLDEAEHDAVADSDR
jgi:two-component system NarL family sensor kinase